MQSLSARRILLTGGNGFVGQYLAPALARAAPDARLVMLVRKTAETSSSIGWEQWQADIASRNEVASAVAQLEPELIVHLAAQSSVGSSHHLAQETWRVNFEGTQNLALSCNALKAPATFLFASSAEVYGRTFLEGPASEESSFAPQNAYARSKAAAELLLTDVLSAEMRLIVVRPFNHTGPGQDQRFVLPSFARQIAQIEAGHRSAEVEVGNLDAARDFLDVGDVVRAYMMLLGSSERLPNRSTFNVSSGTAHKIGAILELMRSQAHKPFAIKLDPSRLRPADIPSAIGMNNKLCTATGWEPTHTIEDVVTGLLEHARAQLS